MVVEPLGSHLLANLEGEGFTLRAALEPDVVVRPGELLRLRPRAERGRWFDPESGSRIDG